MRTETEILNLLLQVAKTLKVEAMALSGSRTNGQAPKDEFQDYDVVYLVENLDELISDLSWIDQFSKRMIKQEVRLGRRRLYLMLFEDGNRIDLTLCPKVHIKEWVDSEAGFTVLVDEKGLFESYSPSHQRFWISISVDCSKIHKEVIDFLQFRSDFLVLTRCLALLLSQALLIGFLKLSLRLCQGFYMSYQM